MLFKKIDASSQSTVTTALGIFQTPPTSVAVSSSMYREYLTLNPINSRPFHFKIHPISSFIDLSKCYIFTELKIKKLNADGLPIDLVANEVVAPIQLIGSTFIRNLKIGINGREIFDSNGLYAY